MPTPTTPISQPSATPTVPLPPPTIPTATSTPTASLLDSITAANVPSHLVLTGLALLIASGFIVKAFNHKDRSRNSPQALKDIEKRKQKVVKRIRTAQEAGKASEGDDGNTSNSNSTRSRSASLTGGGTGTERKVSTLLPSPSCITSTSAAFFASLGGALASTKASASTSIESKDDVDSRSREMPGELRIGNDEPDAKKSEGVPKKVKGKKGKAVVATTSGTSLRASGEMSRSNSQSKRTTKDVGLERDLAWRTAGRTEAGVQVSHLETDPPLHRSGSTNVQDSTQTSMTPSNEPPQPSSSHPPRIITATASVQTSPRLLSFSDYPHPLVPSSPPPRPRSPPAISSPAPTRPTTLPLPFDLHASFQATPPVDLLDYSSTLSPPLSPTPSRSPSNAASVSSGSPTGRRAPSPSTRRTSTSSTAALQPNGALSTSSSRSRKQARKASTASGANVKAVVGLPRPAESVGNGSTGDRSREATEDSEQGMSTSTTTISVTASKGRGGNGRDRPTPIPIPSPSNGIDSTPHAHRRLSTASSAYSTSNISLTSSGSPYSADRVALPMMPPAMTMTPPDFHRRPSSVIGFDREEAMRWSANTNTRMREASLRGLGVELEQGMQQEDGSVDEKISHSGRGNSPKPPSHEYFALPSHPPPVLGRSTSSYFGSPDSSPHPIHRTYVPSSPSSAPQPLSLNGQPQQQQEHPWSPQPSTPLASTLAYPIASSSATPTGPLPSRPPSRQSSLSVPPSLSQQQLHLQQQQQQQAYAIAQVQAQAAAQYQHVVALQLQAQAQQNQRSRRRAGEGGYDDQLYNSTSSNSAVPNGLVYPITTSNGNGNWPSSSHPASPMVANYSHLAQAVSPTSTTFAPTAVAAHAQAQAQAQMYYSYMSSPAGYQQQQQQQQQHPTRPRINSSVSAVAVLGGGSSNAKNGSLSSPGAGSKASSSPRTSATDKVRQGSTGVGNGSVSSPLGAGAASSTTNGNAVDASDWKSRAKNAEREADRNAKELEIARWRLTVLEDEQRTNEAENQEALKALATRAMRAEARIKLLEDNRKTEQQAAAAAAESSSTAPSPAAASPVAPQEMPLPTGSLVEEAGNVKVVNPAPGQGVHPLTWLDLDSVSFSTRPLNPTRPPLIPSTSSSSSYRKRSGRNSYGNGTNPNDRRNKQNGGGGRRRSSQSTPQLYHPPSPFLHVSSDPIATMEDSMSAGEEDDVVIVLDAPKRRTTRATPSRRNSYALSIGGGVNSSGVTGGEGDVSGNDASLYLDDDEGLPSVEFDSDPTSQAFLARSLTGAHIGGNSSDSQNDSIAGDDTGHPDYVGFLPGSLLKARANSRAIDSSQPASDASLPDKIDFASIDEEPTLKLEIDDDEDQEDEESREEEDVDDDENEEDDEDDNSFEDEEDSTLSTLIPSIPLHSSSTPPEGESTSSSSSDCDPPYFRTTLFTLKQHSTNGVVPSEIELPPSPINSSPSTSTPNSITPRVSASA